MRDSLTDFQRRIEILEAGFHVAVETDLVNPALLCIQANVSQIVLQNYDRQLHKSDNGFGAEIDACQRYNLVDELERTAFLFGFLHVRACQSAVLVQIFDSKR